MPTRLKILTFIPQNGYHVAIDAAEALKELGHAVGVIDLRMVRKEVLPILLEKTIKRIRPDFIFTTNRVGLLQELFDEMKTHYVSWWTIDPANLKPPPSPYYHIFIIDKTRVDELRDEGYESVHYLPFGVNPKRFKPIQLSKEDMERYGCDVSFAGACMFSMGYIEEREYLNRVFGEEVVKALIEDQLSFPQRPIKESFKEITGKDIDGEGLIDLRRIEYEAMRLWRLDVILSLSGFGIRVYGDSGWKELEGIHYGGWLDEEGLCRLYNASKINLSIQISTMKGSLNKRTFEVPACGGFLINSLRDSLFFHFKDKKEAVYFKDKEELKELARYYLDHPDERMAIAQRARERILREHTMLHRMKTLVEMMGRVI